MITAIVITRELLGSDRLSVEEARIVGFNAPAWQRLADAYRCNGSRLDREFERL
ncbi:hypothetical protein ACFY0A_39595 [Streptomyces sp. NPDC001698]|uniref:hypothetical protein n=1 Tax=Streptomyces sp. NPDC001698 TaxID=3364601 RepID=UPI0036B0879A